MTRALATLKKNGPRDYNLSEVCRLRLIPWVRDSRTLRALIAEDRKGKNLLRATITGKGAQRRYSVSSINLMVYLTTYGPAFAHKISKTRHAK